MDEWGVGLFDGPRFRLGWTLESGERMYCQPTHPEAEPWLIDEDLGAYLVWGDELFGSLEVDSDESRLQRLLDGDGEEQLLGRYPYNCVIVPKVQGKTFTMYASRGRLPLGRLDLERLLHVLKTTQDYLD